MCDRKLLDAGWKLNSADYGVAAEGYAREDLDDSSWLDSDVPGDVHLDLMRAGLIPDPFVGTNADACLWMEQKDWWYRARFEVPPSWRGRADGSVRLLFHGLDCFAAVYLNGQEIARHANMFRPLEIDVSDRLREQGENVLAVRLASPLFAPLESGREKMAPWGFPRELSRKAQMSYGWDIAPRLVTTGIWRPVELVCIEGARLSDVWVRTRGLGDDSAEMEARVEVEAVTPVDGGHPRVVLEAAGETLEKECPVAAPGRGVVEFAWRVERPDLWWPNGSGEPHLYDYSVRLLAPDGRVLDEREGRFGIRTVELDRSPTEDGGHLFRFRVNGREVFMRGWNWTPPDAIFARATPRRREELLEAALDSGANMLRVWGGGVYEPEDFFEAADRMGLLIWQDFMFSCSRYPQDEEFLAEVRAEAEHVVRAMRSHPSLAVWCGDNECDHSYGGPAGAESNRITREVLPKVLSSLDPDRPYVPSSPHSPAGRSYNDPADSDVHLWHHGQSYRHPYFLEHRARFVSEIGFLSLPDEEVVRRFLEPDASAWPAEGPVWDYHASNCFRVQGFRGMTHVAQNIEACGRPAPGSIQEYVEVTQELQAEAYRTWVADCAGRPDCSGILLWNLCDCWPQVSDAVIAYPMHRKKAFFAAKEAFAAAGRL